MSNSPDSWKQELGRRPATPRSDSLVAQLLAASGQVKEGTLQPLPPTLSDPPGTEQSSGRGGSPGDDWGRRVSRVRTATAGAAARSGQEEEGPAGRRPRGAGSGWVGKAASRPPSLLPLPSQSCPPSLPPVSQLLARGCARGGLAMSQAGPKPAASPRPRRAAAARHPAEVSGVRVRAQGCAPVRERRAAFLGRCGTCPHPVRPCRGRRSAQGTVSPARQVAPSAWRFWGLDPARWAWRGLGSGTRGAKLAGETGGE